MDGTGGGGSSSLISLTEPPRSPDAQTPSATAPTNTASAAAAPRSAGGDQVPRAAPAKQRDRILAHARRPACPGTAVGDHARAAGGLLGQAFAMGNCSCRSAALGSRQLDFRIDVNSATWVEWGQLDGIGDTMARRIVADREENGPFRSIDELRRVKGIGPKTLERLRPWLSIGPQQPPGDESTRPARSLRSRDNTSIPKNGVIGCHWRGLGPASAFFLASSGIGTGGPKLPPVAPTYLP